ncbi:MAG: hypothetical protein KatS3mg023_2921 [Armatimonadota bacterium]|nr:MAG: hypothetical protein KatS3mg023_2921 [Armatimonadota bacterium]
MNYLTWAIIMMSVSAVVSAAPTIGVLQWGGRQATALQNAIRQIEPRAQVVLVSVEDFAGGRLPQGVSLLVVPEADRLPATVGEPLQRWVHSRKGVLFISNEPPLGTWLYRAGER